MGKWTWWVGTIFSMCPWFGEYTWWTAPKMAAKLWTTIFPDARWRTKIRVVPHNWRFSFILLESATHFPRHSKPLAQIKTQLEQSHEAIWKQVERKVWQHLGPLLQKIIASLKTKQPKKYISKWFDLIRPWFWAPTLFEMRKRRGKIKS